MRQLFFFIITIALLNSCNETNNTDFLKSLCGSKSNFYFDTSNNSLTFPTRETNRYLNLSGISSPSDTFFFRFEYSTDTSYKVFQFSLFELQKSYKSYVFPIDRISGRILFDRGQDDIKKYEFNYFPPENDNSFLNLLRSRNILELPSYFDIPGYPNSQSVKHYLIQYSYKCRYKIILYNKPYNLQKNFKEAESIVALSEYLKGKFGF